MQSHQLLAKSKVVRLGDAYPFWYPKQLIPVSQLHRYYLWTRPGGPTRAWDRDYGFDFDTAERIRLKAGTEWYQTLVSRPYGSGLDPIDLYTIPNRVSPALRAAAGERGFVPRWLSCLYNSMGTLALGLFPDDASIPEPWQLVRLEGRKTALMKAGHAEGELAVEVEHVEVRPPLEAYREAQLGPGGLEAFIGEFWKIDPRIRGNLTFPLTSSPATVRTSGGITLSALSAEKSVRQVGAYFDVWERMVPPELRIRPAPPSLQRGKWVPVPFDSHIQLSDRPPKSQDRTYSLLADSGAELHPHYARRDAGVGEMSFQSVLRVSNSGRRQAFLDFLHETTRADVPVSDMRELFETDQELDSLARNVTGMVHGEIAWRHLMRPQLGATEPLVVQSMQQLRERIDTELLDLIPMDTIRHLRVQHLTRAALPSLERLTLALARGKHHFEVDEDDHRSARDTFMRNLSQILAEPQVAEIHVPLRRFNKTERGILLLEFLMEETGQDVPALWERIGQMGHFEDMGDLQVALDRLANDGFVWHDAKGHYFVV